MSLAAVGSFDSLNPFIVRGSPAVAVSGVWETLMTENADEAEAGYCHLAQSVDVASDHKTVTFVLRPEARFSDGTPVLASDVAWSFNTLREHGRPLFRTYWADVAEVQAVGDRTVVFHLKDADNLELPSILGQVPVMPEHWWKGRNFEAPLSDPPVGSGPYRVDRVVMGQTIVMRRVPDWWAANIPTGRGRFNFDTMRYDYYRDPTVSLEAFKAGQVDFRQENSAKNWSTAYDFPAVGKGLVKLERLAPPPADRPTGLRHEYAARPLQGSPGAAGDGRGVRLPVDEQEPVLWALHAHRQLLQQQRFRGVRRSAGRRAGPAGAVPQAASA